MAPGVRVCGREARVKLPDMQLAMHHAGGDIREEARTPAAMGWSPPTRRMMNKLGVELSVEC